MNRDQLIASGQALLDLDAKGALVPHGIGGHARSIIEGFIALERPPTPDHTNAEVSDERLRETEETRKLLDEAADFSERMTSQPWACELVERLADALNRRSVTSQASEGEVVAYRVRHKGDERWALTFTDPRVTPSGAINDEIEAEPLGLITEGLVTPPYSRGVEAALVKGDEASASSPVTSPPKRVERLETALADVLREATTAKPFGSHTLPPDLLARLQALQGGRS